MNMIRAYPLALDGMIDGVKLAVRNIVDIYEMNDKIIFVSCGFGTVSKEEYDNGCRAPSYIMLDIFSADFSEHSKTHREYHVHNDMFINTDMKCYWENGRFLLNTKYYEGFGCHRSIARIFEIHGAELIELDDAPIPVKTIYNDKKNYVFGEYNVRMASPFVMECKSQISGKSIWKLKVNAHLYSEIEEKDGILFFGTAGNGGRFFGVSLADGNVIFSHNTGGTERFLWYENSIVLSDKNGKPILLDPIDGSETRKIDFEDFKFTAYQYMLIKNDRLYAVASGKDTAYAVCVDL